MKKYFLGFILFGMLLSISGCFLVRNEQIDDASLQEAFTAEAANVGSLKSAEEIISYIYGLELIDKLIIKEPFDSTEDYKGVLDSIGRQRAVCEKLKVADSAFDNLSEIERSEFERKYGVEQFKFMVADAGVALREYEFMRDNWRGIEFVFAFNDFKKQDALQQKKELSLLKQNWEKLNEQERANFERTFSKSFLDYANEMLEDEVDTGKVNNRDLDCSKITSDLLSGKFGRAKSMVNQCIALDPENLEYYSHLDVALHGLNRYKEARKVKEKIVDLVAKLPKEERPDTWARATMETNDGRLIIISEYFEPEDLYNDGTIFNLYRVTIDGDTDEDPLRELKLEMSNVGHPFYVLGEWSKESHQQVVSFGSIKPSIEDVLNAFLALENLRVK